MTPQRSACIRTAAAVAAAAILAACASAGPSATEWPASEPARNAAVEFERDRAAILAMAGDYHVRFDFIETVPLASGYQLKDRKISGGDEVVRVIEDRGDFISLQHILVVGADDKKFAIKHWRQDWAYEPKEVLTFVGGATWTMRPASAGERRGRWSQTVYQTDDSPRYGALAAWSHEDGVSEWAGPRAWRPLPRRDQTTRDDYHAVDAINRHVITPGGWAHEQDNTKLALNGPPHALVREVGVNTYERSESFDVAIAEDYWAKTKDFWATVRAEWSRMEEEHQTFGLTVQGEPEALYAPLMELAEAVAEGKTPLPDAQAAARLKIAELTTATPKPLEQRIAATPALKPKQ